MFRWKTRGCVVRAGAGQVGFELPTPKVHRGSVRYFLFGHYVPQFTALEAMNRLHRQMKTALRTARNLGAVIAFGAFEEKRPAHAII